MKKQKQIKWLSKPEEHNYPAAESYLGLIMSERVIKDVVKRLKKEKVTHFKAKDIFRASKLSLLGVSNFHIKKNYKKIDKGEKISPLLLVRDITGKLVIIADGYHRLCAVYHYNENEIIPCKIVSQV